MTPVKGSLVRQPVYGLRPRNAGPEPEPAAAAEPVGPHAPLADGRISGIAPCIAYLLVDFVRPMTWFPALAAVRPGMLVAIWGFIVVVKSGRLSMPKPMPYVFAFMAVMVINVPLALNNYYAFEGMLAFAILIFGCVLPLAVLPNNLRTMRFILSVYVFFHVPTAIYGLLHSGVGISGWVADENDLAFTLNVALGMGIYLFTETRSPTKRIALLATMGILISSVVATMSRGGFLGITSLATYLLIFGPHRRAVLAIGMIAVIALVLFAPAAYWDEIRTIEGSHQKGDTGEKRLYFWGIAWRMFLDHPLTGVGTNNYGIRAPEYESRQSEGVHMWGRVAHSLYFTLLAEEGIAGVVLFLLMAGWSFRNQAALRRWSKSHPEDSHAKSAALLGSGITAGIFAVLATGTFISVLYYPIFWVLLAFLSAVVRTSGRDTAAAS